MADIYQFLDSLNIQYVKHEHPALFTCEQADAYYAKMPGGDSKNLFLRNKKGNKHFLVVIKSSDRLDLKTFAQQIQQRLSFASEERLLKYLQLTPGSVTPFGLINDPDHHVEVYIDEDLMEYDQLNFHPNINTATLNISTPDFRKFLDATGHEYQITKLPKQA